MFASSTPVFSRKRKSSGAISSPGVSPIRRYLPLPKLPKGITVQISRAPLRNKNINQESRPASSAYEEKILPSLLNGIKPVVIQPLKKPKKEDVPVAAKSSCGSSADVANPYSNKAKKNEPHFPELIVISDSDEERQVEETIRRKTRLSVAAKRRRLTSAVEEAGDIPSLHAFLKKESRPTYSSTSSVFRASEKTQPVLTGKRCISIRLDLGPDALPGLDTKSSNAPNSTRSRTRRATRKEVVEGFGALKELKQEDTIEFAPAAEISSRTEISKFTLAGVESWKEVKDQPGAFFSKGLQAYSSGVDGDAFPARAGYLKMSVKTKMEIPSCGTNVVFTVIKGKGYLKNKTNGTDEKTEMNVGDIFVAPRGSNFSFINQATKNEFFLSYVKIV